MNDLEKLDESWAVALQKISFTSWTTYVDVDPDKEWNDRDAVWFVEVRQLVHKMMSGSERCEYGDDRKCKVAGCSGYDFTAPL